MPPGPPPHDSPHSSEQARSGDWHRPSIEQQGFLRYLTTLRERIWLILGVVLVTMTVAGLYLATADKVYEAQAELLVTPVSSDDLPGLGLIQDSPDPTRDVETAARLVTGRDVAVRVVRTLGLDDDPDDLLAQVSAQPIAQSNIVAITAKADTPERARDIANGFAAGVVADRTRQLHVQLDALIERLNARLEPASQGQLDTVQANLREQIARYETVRAGPDPTLRFESRAAAPDAASSPKPKLTLVAGLLSGLMLGIGGAFALTAIDPRLRREEQLRELYRVPVLARIPKEMRAPTTTFGKRRWFGARRKTRRALPPGQLSPATLEAYRTLRAMLAARGTGDTGQSVLVTGPSPSEGKTTTAINLASAFASAGNTVILIEADFRRPTVGAALGVKPHVGIGKVLLGRVALEDALIPSPQLGPALRLLLVDRTDHWLPEVLSLPAAGALLDEAASLADYVVIDSPPLTEVIDALPIAQQVDDVLLVVRLGSSRLTQLERLGDLLAQNDIKPTGFAVVGAGSSEKETYYLSARADLYAPDEALPAPPKAPEPAGQASADFGSPALR